MIGKIQKDIFYSISTVHLAIEVPEGDASGNNDIERMLGAELWYLDTGVDGFHYIITYAINFIAENQRVFFIFFGLKFIQHDAVFSLLNGDDRVAFIAQLLNRL